MSSPPAYCARFALGFAKFGGNNGIRYHDGPRSQDPCALGRYRIVLPACGAPGNGGNGMGSLRHVGWQARYVRATLRAWYGRFHAGRKESDGTAGKVMPCLLHQSFRSPGARCSISAPPPSAYPMSLRSHILLVVVLLTARAAIATDNRAPQFDDYPAKGTFTGSNPAKVMLDTREARNFRTTLREFADKPADFSGHYVLAHWGCGMACAEGAVIDQRTGRVVFTPPIY